MKYYIVFVVFLNLYSGIIGATYNGCSITFPKTKDRTQPLLLKNTTEGLEISIPTSGKVSFHKGQQSVLFCPNARNYLEQSNTNLTVATCVTGEGLQISNQHFQFDTLQCKSPPKGGVSLTSTKCGNDKGMLINIGFSLPYQWITLIRVCYDSTDGNALYTEHDLHGEAVKFNSHQTHRPGFQVDGAVKGLSLNSVYKKATQNDTFKRILGSQNLVDRYINNNTYLVRGHLSPDADFSYSTLQFSTYFFINVCPQWDPINSGNWLGIEFMVRKTAEKYNETLKITTGTHGILALRDANNNLQNITLGVNGKVPVPKFLWKIVYLASSKDAIAFVTVNDPFLVAVSEDEVLCPDISCNTNGWNSRHWVNIQKGFTYCCDVRLLKNRVPTIPKMNIRGILKGRK